jgi:hypothetical protein
MTTRHLTEVYEARDLFSAIGEDGQQDEFALSLIRAGQCLLRELQRHEREDELRLARSGMSERARISEVEADGHALLLGEDAGGARHFLGGKPVHAGAHLFVLSSIGWMAGRYEWSYGVDQPGRLYVPFPGAHESVALRIDSGMRLAWPEELGC